MFEKKPDHQYIYIYGNTAVIYAAVYLFVDESGMSGQDINVLSANMILKYQ